MADSFSKVFKEITLDLEPGGFLNRLVLIYIEQNPDAKNPVRPRGYFIGLSDDLLRWLVENVGISAVDSRVTSIEDKDFINFLIIDEQKYMFASLKW